MHTQLLIDGRWQDAADGAVLPVTDPCTGEVFAHAACAGAADIDTAVAAARRAFDGPWAAIKPGERAKLLWRLAELIDARADELAALEVRNTGKPLLMARRFDIAMAAECLRYHAGWCTKLEGSTRTLSLPGEWHAYTRREPLGVAGLIVPWNVPLPMAVGKVAPALAAGCTAVLKPAELTPLTALRLGALALEAGLPPGVLNVVPGLGPVAGQSLVEHQGVDKLSFTGSTAVGQRLASAAAMGNLKRVSLELGGKSPVFVFPDADIARAIPAAAAGIFANAGQVCAAGSRLFVHRSVADRVLEGVAERARGLRVAPGTAPDAEMGPLISERQRERVLGYVASGRSEGAAVLAGGATLPGPGYFVQPTVMVNTRPEMAMVRDEIFGPVLATFVFGDEDLATLATLGNATDYGLSASIWTRDLARAHKLAARLKAGNVRINAAVAPDLSMPFGGMKRSGWGRENGREGVESFTELKSVAVNLD